MIRMEKYALLFVLMTIIFVSASESGTMSFGAGTLGAIVSTVGGYICTFAKKK